MNIRTFKLITLSIIGTFILTGCVNQRSVVYTSKNSYLSPNQFDNHIQKNFHKKTVTEALANEYEVITIITRSGYSNFKHQGINEATRAALQKAAEVTLVNDKKFFAFVYPSQISNYHGSMINTPKEYLEKCEVNIGTVLVGKQPQCGLFVGNYNNSRLITNKTMTQIITFNERKDDFLLYDAKEVLKYIKEKEYYNENIKATKIINIKSAFTQKELQSI